MEPWRMTNHWLCDSRSTTKPQHSGHVPPWGSPLGPHCGVTPLHIRDHVPNVPFDHKHDVQFSLAVLSIAVDDPPMTNVTGKQDICPCSCLCFYLFLLSEGKVSLCARLHHWCTCFRVKIVPRVGKKSNRIQFASKAVTSSRATFEEKV